MIALSTKAKLIHSHMFHDPYPESYCLWLTFFVLRWKEASGVDGACGTCESGDVVPYTAPAVTFANPPEIPIGGLLPPPGNAKFPNTPRKQRDVAQSESMCSRTLFPNHVILNNKML